jgi:ribonucleoside-diphosphate reductase alpha chain
VHKKELHDIHFEAWKKGVKSLYYCRSKSIQRAESAASWARSKDKAPTPDRDREPELVENKYDECLACQ